jgi:hypothetical protein
MKNHATGRTKKTLVSVEPSGTFRTSILMSRRQKLELERVRLELREIGVSVSMSQILREAIDRRLDAHEQSMKRLGRR